MAQLIGSLANSGAIIPPTLIRRTNAPKNIQKRANKKPGKESPINPKSENEWDIYSFSFIADIIASDWDISKEAKVYIWGEYPRDNGITNGVIWYDNIMMFRTPKIG